VAGVVGSGVVGGGVVGVGVADAAGLGVAGVAGAGAGGGGGGGAAGLVAALHVGVVVGGGAVGGLAVGAPPAGRRGAVGGAGHLLAEPGRGPARVPRLAGRPADRAPLALGGLVGRVGGGRLVPDVGVRLGLAAAHGGLHPVRHVPGNAARSGLHQPALEIAERVAPRLFAHTRRVTRFGGCKLQSDACAPANRAFALGVSCCYPPEVWLNGDDGSLCTPGCAQRSILRVWASVRPLLLADARGRWRRGCGWRGSGRR
jgi:hypothetical protein